MKPKEAGILLGTHNRLYQLIKMHHPLKKTQYSLVTLIFTLSDSCHFSIVIIIGDFKRLIEDLSETSHNLLNSLKY